MNVYSLVMLEEFETKTTIMEEYRLRLCCEMATEEKRAEIHLVRRTLSSIFIDTPMPKNKGKGGKNKRRGKNEATEKRELRVKVAGQEYGQVSRMLGNGRLECYCFDGKNRMCHIRGKMRKREWVNQVLRAFVLIADLVG